MLNQHTTYFSGGNLGIPADYAWIVWLGIILIGWHVVFQLLRRAGKVSGSQKSPFRKGTFFQDRKNGLNSTEIL